MKKYFKNGNGYLVIALCIMIILFISSSQTYQQQSQVSLLSKVLQNEPFKDSLNKVAFSYAGSPVSIADSGYFKFIEFFIRKAAHFLTYFILGGSLYLGIQPKMKTLLLPVPIAWLAATGYAALDEFHQMLTGGRTPLFQDVILDSVGAATAILLVLLFRGVFKRK